MKIIFNSAYKEFTDKTKLDKLKYDKFLEKPISCDTLINLMK